MQKRTHILGLLSLCLLLGIIQTAQSATGRTPGTTDVSRSGAGTYQASIWLPPGPNGVQPELSIVYDSQSGNASMGPGWGIAGLSKIGRLGCSPTYAQDGAPAAITLSYADRFCLDGSRLRLTSSNDLSTYGQNLTTYQTEIDTFSKIVAYGTTGNGPTYFKMQGKNGLLYEYGNTTDSRVLPTGSTTVADWLLNKVSDRSGNNYVVSYALQNGETVPVSISYTPNSAGSGTYNNSIVFTYGSDTLHGSEVGYIAGALKKNSNLLTSIAVKHLSTTVRKYFFTYQLSPTTDRQRLSQIQECADDAAANCLSATTVTYQNGQSGVAATSVSALGGSSAQRDEVRGAYDFNGDGRKDIAYWSGSLWYVAFASASGYGAPVSTGINVRRAVFGDFTSSGKDGLLAQMTSGWSYFAWNGSAFVASAALAPTETGTHCVAADTNGDGRPDLVTQRADYTVYVRLNTSSGGVPSLGNAVYAFDMHNLISTVGSWISAAFYEPTSTGVGVRFFDANGDGRQDLLASGTYHDGNYESAEFVMLSGPTGTTFSVQNFSTNLPFYGFIDFNSDPCTDVLGVGRVYGSDCRTGWTALFYASTTTQAIGAVDWDGDGRTDVLVNNGGAVGVYVSNGDAAQPFSALIPTSIPVVGTGNFITMDSNGDGLDDLGFRSSTAPYPVTFFPHNGASQLPDLVTSISDGYGVTSSLAYVPISQSNYIRGNAAVYPEADVQDATNVVSQMTASDGTGGNYTRTFNYGAARQNLAGRGFEGFQTMSVVDSRNGLLQTWSYSQAFPFTGFCSKRNCYSRINPPSSKVPFTRLIRSRMPRSTVPPTISVSHRASLRRQSAATRLAELRTATRSLRQSLLTATMFTAMPRR